MENTTDVKLGISHPHCTSPLKGEAIFRSLPWGEGLKGGGFRVRLGFGKMTEN
ncbi:hypothetical protein D3OALGA1CA_5041 [Olavius algarvensis associated proteobacterium Delta 3]|nr:hypothetical protein D3OALGA1CA_5041 [Olavius algarvensis associated proteobacterium Delta 3]